MKKFLSILLVFCMVTAMLPGRVSAQEAQTSLDNSDMTVSGTNGFGVLLSNEIAESQEEASGYQAGYAVTDLTFSGNTATVAYDALEEATLVVAVYTEDGLQMLASGRTTVSPDETETTVTIDGTMPEYFYATAFLLDPYDYVPLCEEYSTPMYTREMQALLDSTVDDYDAERVYNLDDDNTTNFAVFAEDTIVIREQDGVNTVVSADDENMVYVIENADATVTSLTEGNVLAHPYGEDDILIVKVASITVSGTTATITGAPLEMNEAFAYVKVESGAQTDAIAVDSSEADEGITYTGLLEVDNAQARSSEAAGTKKWVHSFELKKTTKYTNAEEDVTAKAEISGSLKFSLSVSVKFYVSFSHQYLEASVAGDVTLAATITGEARFESIKLGTFGVSPVPGVYIGLNPVVVVEFKGEASLTIAYGFKLGFAVENRWGSGLTLQNRSTSPKLTTKLKFDGSLFFGVDMVPKITILSEAVAKASMSDLVGVEINGTLEYNNDEPKPGANLVHGCTSCVNGEVAFKMKLSVSVQFLNSDKLKLELKIIDIHKKWKDFYWSLDYDTFAWGECPYRAYRVSIEVTDADGAAVPETEVSISNGDTETTNENGIAIFYLPTSGYTASAEISGTTYDVKFVVNGKTRKVSLSPNSVDEDFGILGSQDSNGFLDADSIRAYGSCGKTVYWALYGDGTLQVYGEGPMEGYKSPWEAYRSYVKRVIFEDGVTYISSAACQGCTNLTEITIAGSVTFIDTSAFGGCTKLEEITIPGTVTGIATNAFGGCTALKRVTLQEGVQELGNGVFKGCTKLVELTLPTSLTQIGYEAFRNCTSLKTVTIPCTLGSFTFAGCKALETVIFLPGVTEIHHNAFDACTALKEITFSETITKIWDGAFRSCSSLPSLTIPGNILTIDAYAFRDCVSLTRVDIQEGVQRINDGAFLDCSNLAELNIPTSVTYVGSSAFSRCRSLQTVTMHCDFGSGVFSGCTALTTVTILDGVTTIRQGAFKECSNLTEIHLPDSITAIQGSAFLDCAKLRTITIPRNVTVIPTSAFANCTMLESIELPAGITEIGSYAFEDCTSLTAITIPENVTKLGEAAFEGCKKLTEIMFCGDAPTFQSKVFKGVTATVYYPADNATWTADVLQNHYGNLTWVPYTPEVSTVSHVTADAPVQAASFTEDVVIPDEPEEDMSPDAIYGGEYETEVVDNRILKTATFSGLVPGAEYVMLALKSIETEDILAADNLLGILQGTAGADGTLRCQYIQRVNTDVSYVIACGASNKNLQNATITFPEMTANGALQTVNPAVVYDGKTLTEGVDYEITGTVDFTAGGTYTCQIRGIHNYTGTVTCTYTVAEVTVVLGDVNCDEEIDILDANLVVAWYNEIRELEDDQLQAADVNGDGEVDIMDANMIVAYYNEVIDTFPAQK